MSDDRKNDEGEQSTGFSALMAHSLFRFLLAGLGALLISFLIVVFMRFLILGYDRSASAVFTRYLSLPTLTIVRSKDRDPVRIPKPLLRPETPLVEDADSAAETTSLSEQSTFDIPVIEAPAQGIEAPLSLPSLNAAEPGTREKLQQLKQDILADDE